MIKKLFLSFASLLIGAGLLLWVIDFIGWQETKAAFLFFLLSIGFLPQKLELILGGTLVIFILALVFFYYKDSKRGGTGLGFHGVNNIF